MDGVSEQKKVARGFADLKVYRRAFALQQAIFETSMCFPREEQYALTDQIRRASRSVGANIAEAWRKRRYESHFLSKLSDADAELSETQHWLKTAEACQYITEDTTNDYFEQAELIGRMLGKMMLDSRKWCSNYR